MHYDNRNINILQYVNLLSPSLYSIIIIIVLILVITLPITWLFRSIFKSGVRQGETHISPNKY